ncbi:DUF3575 domain-containing protein [Bacteroides intestinalis]|jgi:hypothetical protein|uniref:DUF3575 domain-containing protein n=1 Tax=Bacteroides intestinalis TaxID=329854 RepID=UPI0022E04985|nr:DUF3575 domain-containing protein [Bacteroides intestinalis]
MNIPIIYKRFFFFCGLLFALLPGIHAQNKVEQDASGKPMVLYFRFDKAVVDKEYMDNARTLRHLDEVLSDRNLTGRIDSINILSFASPDGNRKYNERLAWQRSTTVKGYLVWKYPHLDQYRIHPRPQGENWQEFRRLIAGDENIPNRNEVLQIIDRNPDSDRCKALLRKLDGGRPYRYIQERILRYLRNASVCTVWIRQDSLPGLPEPVAPNAECLNKPCELPHPQAKDVQEQAVRNGHTIKDVQATEKRPLFALKTNLLFDAALMPNVEIEIPFGTRWSLNAEYMFPWWLFEGDEYALQILMGGLEGRYWLGSKENRMNREVLTGHFLGLYAGGGKYDLQWKENGYQGEFFIAAGISYGWATRIAHNLHLELNIGIGVLRTDYRHYHARDNYQTLLWQENGQYTWFGPTKAKISLVWLLNRKVKTGKGGGR